MNEESELENNNKDLARYQGLYTRCMFTAKPFGECGSSRRALVSMQLSRQSLHLIAQCLYTLLKVEEKAFTYTAYLLYSEM